jgi:hypothetical protein
MRRALLLLFLLPTLLQGQIGGRSTFQFLNQVVSARVAGQGGSAIASPVNDLNFALYNPALLNADMHGQFGLSVVDFVSDIQIADVAYAHSFDSTKANFFVQLLYMDYGQFDRANIIGIRQGEFSASDLALNIGYAYDLDSNWSFGATLKTINSVYDVFNAWGMALDAGITYQIPHRRMAFSLLFRNMGMQFDSYGSEREPLPFEIQFGFSNRFEHLPLRWQITLEQLETWDLRYRDPNRFTLNQFTGEVDENFPSIWNNLLRHVVLGLEFAPSESFNLQFGYNFRRRQELNLASRRTSAGFSFGGGLRIYKFHLNYSRNLYHIAGGANQISIRTDLQSFRKK